MQTFLTAPERALRRRREPVRLVPKPECAKGKAGGARPRSALGTSAGCPFACGLVTAVPFEAGLSALFHSAGQVVAFGFRPVACS